MIDRYIKHGIYRHYKNGKLYEIIGLAYDTTNNTEVVIYKPLYYCEHQLFTKKFKEFFEKIDENKYRFEIYNS